MFRRFASNLIIVFGCIAFAIVGLGPRGAALCIGGGHAIGEMIVAACETGGHKHESDCSDHAQLSGCAHDAEACVLPHDHHSHDDGHAPCADIPLDQDEYRGSVSSGVKFAAASAASVDHFIFVALSSSPRVECGVPRLLQACEWGWIAVAQTQSSLRAVILQV